VFSDQNHIGVGHDPVVAEIPALAEVAGGQRIAVELVFVPDERAVVYAVRDPVAVGIG
jgi:hypothetical protein